MNKKDLQQIKELFTIGFQEGFAQIWEHNLEPVFSDLQNQIDILGNKVNTLPTKEYLDEKIAGIREDFNLRIKK